MATAVQWAKCWLLLYIIGIFNTAGEEAENRTELEFGGLGPEENSTEIEENNYINLTVHLNDQNVFQFKISYQQNNLTVDLCKFVRNTTCETSDYSNATYCKCLNNHTVQFLKKASSSDKGLYTWKWRHGRTPEKQRDIFINVKQGNRSDDTATSTTIVCVLLAMVCTATASVVFWMRNKNKFSIEVKDCGRYYQSTGSDNQVNDQASNDVENPHPTVVIKPTAHHSYDPNYAEVNDLDRIQHYDPNDADIKKQDKSQPLQSSYNEINMDKRSDDLLYAIGKKQGTSQSVDPIYPSVNSQPLDPYYSDIKEPTSSHSYDPNRTNDKEHDENTNYDPNYADINEHEASQPPDPVYSDVKEQQWSQSYDTSYAEVKVEENSKTDDTIYAHVKKQTMKNSDNSTDAHVKTDDTNQTNDLLYADVKKQESNLAVDTTYPHVKGQDTEQKSAFAYSPKNSQRPAQPDNPTYVRDKEDTSEPGDFVYNHIRQHDDPNYAHIETNTRQLADLTFQQVKGHNDLSYTNVKEENASKEDGLIYDHIKQQDMNQPGHFHVDKEDTIQSDDNYDHLINCSGVLVKEGPVP